MAPKPVKVKMMCAICGEKIPVPHGRSTNTVRGILRDHVEAKHKGKKNRTTASQTWGQINGGFC